MELTHRQKDIVDAAIHIIACNGLCELTTKNIANEIKLSEAALYRHFTSKEEMLNAILDYFENISKHIILDIIDKHFSPIDSIREFVLDRYRMFEQNPDFAKVMFTEELFNANRSLKAQITKIMHYHREFLEAKMIQAQSDGVIRSDIGSRELFRVIVGSMRFLITQWNLTDNGFKLYDQGYKLFKSIELMIKEKK